MDPAEVRRRNLVPAFSEPHTTPTGAVYDTGDYPAALDTRARRRRLRRAAGRAGRPARARRRRAARHRAVRATSRSPAAATEPARRARSPTSRCTPTASATVLTGTSPHGQGHATAWAMLASEETGIPMDKITVIHGDTDLIPDGGRHRSARAACSRAARRCGRPAIELVELARRRAAELLEADPDDLVVDKDRAGMHVARLARHRGDLRRSSPRPRSRCGSARVFTAPGPTFPFGAHVAVVEVDTQTGKARLQRLVAVDDAGTILNPLLAEGQRHGGFAQGAAQALIEEVRYDADGNPETSTLATYPFLSATEVPSFELVEMATPTSYNPLGAKGIGEAGTIGSTPAVQNAVDRRGRRTSASGTSTCPPRRSGCGRAIQRAHGGGVLMQVNAHGQRRSPRRRDRGPAAARALPARGVRAARDQRRLRHHLLRRLHGAARRRVGEVLHGARRAGRRAARSPPSRAWPARTASCTRCRRRSAPSTGCSAGSARRAW